MVVHTRPDWHHRSRRRHNRHIRARDKMATCGDRFGRRPSRILAGRGIVNFADKPSRSSRRGSSRSHSPWSSYTSPANRANRVVGKSRRPRRHHRQSRAGNRPATCSTAARNSCCHCSSARSNTHWSPNRESRTAAGHRRIRTRRPYCRRSRWGTHRRCNCPSDARIPRRRTHLAGSCSGNLRLPRTPHRRRARRRCTARRRDNRPSRSNGRHSSVASCRTGRRRSSPRRNHPRRTHHLPYTTGRPRTHSPRRRPRTPGCRCRRTGFGMPTRRRNPGCACRDRPRAPAAGRCPGG